MSSATTLPVCVKAAYRLWSATYDDDPNPILALERHIVREQLGSVSGQRVLDIGTGTGYWLAHARSEGARAFGLDLSAEMLSVAIPKHGLSGSVVQADMSRLPLRQDAADVAICSMAVGYVYDLKTLFREFARVSRSIIVSDLHPAAIEAGWRRGFAAAGNRYEIGCFAHTMAQLDEAAGAAGLKLEWRAEAHIDEPEREIFVRAGRDHVFEVCREIPAILASRWIRP